MATAQEAASPTSPGGATGPNGGAPPDLWSSILDSVSGSRGVVTKNIILLGTAKSGKSTLLSRLSSPTGESTASEEDAAGTTAQAGPSSRIDLDLGLSYNSFDVRDDADEETVARLGVYQLPSPLPPYPALLPLALSRDTLLESLAIIVLDWERPWQFLKDLQSWLGVLSTVLKGKGVADGWEAVEARERLEAHLRRYHEPPIGNTASTATPSASQLPDADAPLPQGILVENIGLGLVIVCTKADQINTLERDRDFKEEQFDYIQQTLRTISLRYGAALFFTSHTRPGSFVKLRSYLLHRLFSQATPSTASTAPTTAPSTSRAFPFPYRANVVDRDQVLVPTGWDSWGKIKILRDRFDPDGVGKGWEWDMEQELDRLRGRSDVDTEKLNQEGRRVISAVRIYDEVVVDMDGDSQPINMANSHVEAQDEQDFLKVHYETLQKDREKDPRSAFAARPGVPGSATSEAAATFGASVVGPMSNAGLGLPSVERALERDPDDMTARLAKLARRESTTSAGIRSPTFNTFPSPSLSATSPNLNGSTSPQLTSTHLSPSSSSQGGTGASGGQAQNEVLANFFQSLLAARGTNGAGRVGGVQGLAAANSASASPVLGSSTSGRPGSAAGSAAMNSRSNSQQQREAVP